MCSRRAMADNEERDLRRELAKLERGPGKRYPRELRARVATWARREMASGRGFHGLARRLGLHPTSLRTWLEDAAASGAVVPVEIVDATTTASAEPASRSRSDIRSDSGRVEAKRQWRAVVRARDQVDTGWRPESQVPVPLASECQTAAAERWAKPSERAC